MDRRRPWPSPSNGTLPDGVTPKDVILAVIAKIGTGGGQGYIVEYRGSDLEQMAWKAG
jgi:3-isopropylmalate/(R)-2-methylmalate dehydratase large subunit